jgi:hypothetical protein
MKVALYKGCPTLIDLVLPSVWQRVKAVISHYSPNSSFASANTYFKAPAILPAPQFIFDEAISHTILRTYPFVCFAKLGFGFFAVYFFAISLLYQRRIVSGVKNSHFLRRFQDNFLPFFANIARSESVYFMRLPSDSNFDFKIRLAASK